MQTTPTTFVKSVMLIIIAGALTGCAINVTPRPGRVAFVGTTGEQRLPQKIALRLNKDFTNYIYNWKHGDQAINFHFGELLSAYARNIADAHFQSVQIIEGDEGIAASDAGLILTPKVLKIGATSPVMGWSKQEMTLEVEWSLKKAGRDTPIWITTVEGNGKGGFASEALLENTVTNLWQASPVKFKQLHTLKF